ncbi:C-terminal processing peptidase-3 [Isosphaera pallida ATCC 43644]|jgi:carboxyl-terminal processing protease|uniref:C-terminal processing peptidase-3 n=1 Tax=Isosphaera pallida (strain ATCC 43644 / DSM 9630 / IS1B) TaxID=575540 RepID=E8QX36_ISOPI|nr:S41 family peptidase [Isosphaera pallida]ADV60869.1 C-terminal processing peptidase-3 [Isosphaera pallida ATCC 43644]
MTSKRRGVAARIGASLAILALVGGLWATPAVWSGFAHAQADDEDEIRELYGLFVEALEQAQANYVRPVSRKELIEEALRGMCRKLDQNSTYFNAGESNQFRRSIEGSFGGIGIQVGTDTASGRLKVIAPMAGTPAQKAGILAGDLILGVDDRSTDGLSTDQVIELLQGRPGTEVKLKVLHVNAREPVEVICTRSIIDVPSVLGDRRRPDGSWEYWLDPEHKIGYIRLTAFVPRTAADLKEALDTLKSQEVKGLILDLRDNPGGLLSAAVEVSDLFLDQGVIVSTRGRNVEERTFKATASESDFLDIPMVVLINQYSASASEILSACLQDHGRAQVVGQRSFGKGSVQNVIELSDGVSVLKLTVATYWRPSGKNIHRFEDAKETDEWGVFPDPDCEIKYNEVEHRRWALARRLRDLDILQPEVGREDQAEANLNTDGQPKPKPVEEAANDRPPTDNADDPAAFEDRQLNKALELLRAKLSKP